MQSKRPPKRQRRESNCYEIASDFLACLSGNIAPAPPQRSPYKRQRKEPSLPRRNASVLLSHLLRRSAFTKAALFPYLSDEDVERLSSVCWSAQEVTSGYLVPRHVIRGVMAQKWRLDTTGTQRLQANRLHKLAFVSRILFRQNLVDDGVGILRSCPLTCVTFRKNFRTWRLFRSSAEFSEHEEPQNLATLAPQVTELTFNDNFYKRLGPGDLPDGLKKLTFGGRYNQPLAAGVLPAGLQKLTFGHEFNQPLDAGVLPAGLQKLTFGHEFNQLLGAGVLPAGLQKLTFGHNFNQLLGVGVIPASVTHLTFGGCFALELAVGVLPIGLTHLVFGWNFNQPLAQGVLPAGLVRLTFGFWFDQPLVEGDLPAGLTHLTLGPHFDQPLDFGAIPASVTHLTVGRWYSHELVVPAGVTHLIGPDRWSVYPCYQGQV